MKGSLLENLPSFEIGRWLDMEEYACMKLIHF